MKADEVKALIAKELADKLSIRVATRSEYGCRNEVLRISAWYDGTEVSSDYVELPKDNHGQ